MTISIYHDTLRALYDQYTEGAVYMNDGIHVRSEKFEFSGFLGSDVEVELYARNSMSIESPSCLAAPKVTLTADQYIRMGLTLERESGLPVRLYAPEQIDIRARQVVFSDFALLTTPQNGSISAARLSIIQPREPSDEYLDQVEIVKSWATDETETIIVNRRF